MTIDTIKKNIHNNVGNNIKLTYNEGRNKIYEYSEIHSVSTARTAEASA